MGLIERKSVDGFVDRLKSGIWRQLENRQQKSSHSCVTRAYQGRISGKYTILIFCWLGWLITAANRQVIDVTKKEIIDEFNLSLLSAGLGLDLTFWALYICTALFGGLMSDRIGRKKLIVPSMFLFSVMMWTTGLAGNFVTLVIFRALAGASIGAFFPVAASFVAETFPKEVRSKAIGLYLTGAILGSIIGWTSAGYVVQTFKSWRLSFQVCAVPMFIVGLLFWLIVKEKPQEYESKTTFKSTARTLFSVPNLLYLWGFAALDLFEIWTIDDWLVFYFREKIGMTPILAAATKGACAASGMAGAVLLGWVADRFGRKPTLIGTLICDAICLFLVTLIPPSAPYFLTLTLSMATSFFELGEFSSLYTFIIESAPAGNYGGSMGFTIFFGNLGGMTGSPIAGFFTDKFNNLNWLLYIPIAAAIAQLPVANAAKEEALKKL